MITVQKLVTRWTKESRGGARATARNATAKGQHIPDGGDASPDSVLLHLVLFGEEVGFSPSESFSVGPLSALRNSADELDLLLEDGALRVVFTWTWRCGAPGRPNSRAMRIRAGQWCRLLHNGRHARESDWLYESTIINVGLDVGADAFTSSVPAETSDNRAELF